MAGKCQLYAVEEIKFNRSEENNKDDDNSNIINDESNLGLEKAENYYRDKTELLDYDDNLMSEGENNINENLILMMEEIDKELNIINNEKDKVLDNIEVLSLEKSSSKTSSEINECDNTESVFPNTTYDVKPIGKERKDLNVFSLNFGYDYNNLKILFVKDN